MDKSWIFSLDRKDWKQRHLILWFCFYFVFTILIVKVGAITLYVLINMLNVGLFALVYYTLRYWQIPNLYQQKKYILFAFSLLCSGLVSYVVYWLIRSYLIEHFFHLPSNGPFVHFGEYLIRVLRFYSPSIVLLVWEFQFGKKQEMNRIQLLEQEKLTSELQFLKAQINPHFLFNTLNNIYSFVVNDSTGASEMIKRLGGILDYALNKSQAKTVELKDELDAITNYLELEQIRYGDRLQVAYAASGVMDQPISPLIILSIIENAFKHGASGDINQPRISIDIRATPNAMHCKVWNSKTKQGGEINDSYKSGLGLSNIKRQLKLIYPNTHELKIQNNKDDFSVELTIKNSV